MKSNLHVSGSGSTARRPVLRIVEVGQRSRLQTGAPGLLADQWRLHSSGYLYAIALQVAAATITWMLTVVMVDFPFPSLLPILAVTASALRWGVGPSLIGATVGACMLDILFIEPALSPTLAARSLSDVALFPIIGLIISVMARYNAADRDRMVQRTRDALNSLLTMAEVIVGVEAERADTSEVIAQRLLDLTCDVLGHPRVSMTFRDLDGTEFYRIVGTEREEGATALAIPPEETSRVATLLERLRTRPVVRLETARARHAYAPELSGDGPVVCAAMQIGTSTIGYLAVDFAGGAYTHSAEGEALAAAAARLAALIIDRDRLLRARMETIRLRDLERTRRDFVAEVSHDLQTPLTAARAALDLLMLQTREMLPADEASLLSNARRNIGRLDIQIDNLLTVNRLDTGMLQPSMVDLDLCDTVFDVLPSIEPLLQEKRQKLSLDLPLHLPVHGDPDQLARVVMNVLWNAQRHTPSGTHITISGEHDAGTVRLTVEDDGLGIPADQLDRIFERFQRLDTTAKGSGLGLAIAAEIAALHRGQLSAESPPGGGARFHLMLPTAPAEPS
jgi:K+-sensing histidine kinase KdpD